METSMAELKPLLCSISTTAKLLAFGRTDKGGRSSVYEKIKNGQLVAVKDDNKTKITMASIESYQASLPRYSKENQCRPRSASGGPSSSTASGRKPNAPQI